MSEPKHSADDYERVMIEADGLIKKSQGFLLFVINQQGDFNAVAYPGDLGAMEQLGLFTAAGRVIEIAEDSIMSNYSYNGQNIESQNDDDDEEDAPNDEKE